MAGMKLRSIGDGLEWLEEHSESAQLTRCTAVQYRFNITRQTTCVVWPFRHLHMHAW